MAQPSHFLKLPRELRDKIHEFTVLAHPSTIKQSVPPQRSGFFASKAPLLLASKQMHNEYTTIVHEVVTSASFPEAIIEASITDVDFASFIAYTEALTPAECEVVTAKLHIRLNFSTQKTVMDLCQNLSVWAQNCESTGMTAEYEVGSRIQKEDWLSMRSATFIAVEHMGLPGGEIGKIHRALLAWRGVDAM
ncbi:hypothetical protein LTR85_003624 [Meristemomyces frigidus]|nr:hypothetical protein LTR85_003624 [Meristemomyces frigidus]